MDSREWQRGAVKRGNISDFIAGYSLYFDSVFIKCFFFTSKALVSYSEYSYCGRSLTIVLFFFTYLGTWIGGGTIVGLAEKSYINGASQYWMFGISCVSGILFVLFFNRKIRRLQVTGVAEMLALRFPEYGGAVRIPAAIAQFIRNVTVIGMNFVAMAYMLVILQESIINWQH